MKFKSGYLHITNIINKVYDFIIHVMLFNLGRERENKLHSDDRKSSEARTQIAVQEFMNKWNSTKRVSAPNLQAGQQKIHLSIS